MRLTKPFALFFFSPFAICAFAQTTPRNSDIQNIGRRDINKGTVNFYSLDKEIAMGRQLAAENERQVTLATDETVNEYVNRLGKNIAMSSDAKALPMTFKVVQSSEVGAQSFPGGFVYIASGTIAALENEAELAFMVAQQVAHIAARHGTELASKGGLLNTAKPPITAAGVQSQQTAEGVLVPMQLAHFARRDLLEADFLGMQYLYKAGYDPNAATTALQKIQTLESQGRFKTLVPAAERITEMKKNLRILPARSLNVATTPEFDSIKALVQK